MTCHRGTGDSTNNIIVTGECDLGRDVGPRRVIGEAHLVALARGIDAEVSVEVEEVAAVDLVVDPASPLGLVLGHHLAHVLMHKAALGRGRGWYGQGVWESGRQG